MPANDEILTITEVARALRCSKAHVYKAINGEVGGVSPLPAISMGRRKLVRRSTLEQWISSNERDDASAILTASPEVEAAGRMKGNPHHA